MQIEPMQPLTGFLSGLRMNLRHRQGCYRWTGQGLCVDCQRYTGIPADAIPRVVAGETQYYDRRRVGGAPAHAVPPVVSGETQYYDRRRIGSRRADTEPALGQTDGATNDALDDLTTWSPLYSSAEVCGSASAVPAASGVYAWYFREYPGNVPVAGCIERDGATLLYVGVAPKAPPRDGRAPGLQTLRSRMRSDYRGNAEGSTLRLTLGCLLDDRLGLQLRRVGSGKRMTFASGEATLTDWMAANALVCWHQTDEPWSVERQLLRDLVLPLNLDQPRYSSFHHDLSVLRRAARETARELPVVAG
jgi:hypothetical protein